MIIRNEMCTTDLKTSDFYYDLPQELIAQHPSQRRDASRLMVLDRRSGGVEHRHFFDLPEYLRAGDVLVINDSKVIPARIYGHAEGRPEATLELLLLRQRELDPVHVPGAICRNHGPFTWGKDAAQAVYHAVVLEEVAKMAVYTTQIAPDAQPAPQYVLDKHFLRKHGPNAYYGQKKD